MRSLITTILSVLLIASVTVSHAQENAVKGGCSRTKSKHSQRTSVADPREDDYDVKYVKLNLNMTNMSTTLSGGVTTTAKVVATAMPAYIFELDTAYTIDLVVINGIHYGVTTTGSVRKVVLSSPLPEGAMFTAQVFYNGTFIPGESFFSGISSVQSPSWGSWVTYTLSEAYDASQWWPCKQSLTDKIDSADIWITVPDSLKAGSNGLLQAVVPIGADRKLYQWKERYPIDYYLISAAVGPYIDYSYYMHFTGSTDSMLVQNYIYNNPGTLPAFQSVIDSTALLIDYFSTLYGRYPFWQEKYGHCMAPIGGGMEHQTMTTLGYFEGPLVAHELGHQWFGDNVTCGTWADIFVNEGFASYTEDLFMDHFYSHTRMINDIVSKQNDVKSEDSGTIYVDDPADQLRVFDSRLTYHKGASMLHMLRFVINDDSTFFRVCKTYQATMKNSTATIMDFKNVVQGIAGTSVNGIDIDTFFNQWAYRHGYPIYDITWNKVGDQVYVNLEQSATVPSSVSVFTIPMELRFHSTAGDTIVRVVNNLSSQQFQFTWSKNMTSLIVDPNRWLLYKLNSQSRDTLLSAAHLSVPQIIIYPNPANAQWHAENVPANSTLTITEITGRVLWTGNSQGRTQVNIPAQGLSAGIYLLRIGDANNGSETVYKLQKE